MKLLKVYQPGDSFGEIALISDSRRLIFLVIFYTDKLNYI